MTPAERFEEALAALVAKRYGGNDPLAECIRYILDTSGKRVRPSLCMLTAEVVGGRAEAALPAALAVELVHTYSLVHDDLPCLDNDDLRRGRATAHKKFGDARALLAGDALLTDAFSVLSDDTPGALAADIRLRQVRELAAAAGGDGMVLGQIMDLHWTGRPGARRTDLDHVHLKKTGMLLGAATAMGAAAGGANLESLAQLRDFGRAVGLAFQIQDDVLDESDETGKSKGKDQAAGKLTYLSVMSRDEARAAASLVTRDALASLARYGSRANPLATYVEELLNRRR